MGNYFNDFCDAESMYTSGHKNFITTNYCIYCHMRITINDVAIYNAFNFCWIKYRLN